MVATLVGRRLLLVLDNCEHVLAGLPRVHTAAGYACFVGRAATAVTNTDRAMALEAEGGYDPFEPGLSAFVGALANVYAGDLDRYVDLAALAAESPGPARAFAWPALSMPLSTHSSRPGTSRSSSSPSPACPASCTAWIGKRPQRPCTPR